MDVLYVVNEDSLGPLSLDDDTYTVSPIYLI